MFTKKNKEVSELDKTIDQLLIELQNDIDSESDEYARKVDYVVKLTNLRSHDHASKVSPDTKAIIAGNLAGIIMIIGYERANVVASKAMSLLMKLR